MSKIYPGLKVRHNNINCELDIMDWECNSPPAGFLWIRKLQNIPPLPGLEPIESKAESIGMIHVTTAQVFPITRIQDCVPPVPSMPDTIKDMYMIYFPKKSLKERIVEFFGFVWKKFGKK